MRSKRKSRASTPGTLQTQAGEIVHLAEHASECRFKPPWFGPETTKIALRAGQKEIVTDLTTIAFSSISLDARREVEGIADCESP